MILFIHGFASCGLGEKSRLLQKHFGGQQVLTPDLSPRPDEAITQLQSLEAQHQIDLRVGSSLGGYYATWLNKFDAKPTLLINPALQPHLLLADQLGVHQRWCDQQSFELTHADLQALAGMQRPALSDAEQYLVLLQSDDEVLDYRKAANYYAAFDVVIEQGGHHRFENLHDYLPRITEWHDKYRMKQP